MSTTNNMNVGYGRAFIDSVANLVPTFGKILVVMPSTDPNFDRISDIVQTDPDGVVRLYQTVAAAYAAATTQQDDVIVLSTYGVHELTAMLDISKSRVHFVSMDTFGRLYGQRARINYADGIATTDAFAVKNTGVGNTFTGIKFLNNNTDEQVVATFGEGGEYAVFRNCEFYNSTDLDSDTEAELVLGGDSAQFFDCTFGSLADFVSGDKIRPAVLVDGSVVGTGKVARDVLFQGCKFWKNAGGTTTVMIKITSDDDLERIMEIKDCTFIGAKTGSTPAVAIASATLTKSQVILTGDTVAFNCTRIGTATGIVSGLNVKVATATIGVQCS